MKTPRIVNAIGHIDDDLINSAIYEHCGGSIDSVDFGCLYITDDYAENVGFPERLEDIPDEVIDEANK